MRKVRYIPQMMQSECGLCCIAMLANYFGHYITLGELREYQQPGREGVSARQICQILKWIDFDYSVYKCDLVGLKQLRTPVIAYWRKSHYVVVEKITKRNVFVVDPAMGRVIYTHDEFSQDFSNLAIYMHPTEQTIKREKPQSIWMSMLPMIMIDKWILGGMLVLSGLTYLISLTIPRYIQIIIDASEGTTAVLVLIGVAMLVSYGCSSVANSLVSVLLKTRVYKRFYTKVIQKITNAEYRYFENRQTGNIIYSINSIESINEFYAGNVITAIISFGATVVLTASIVQISSLVFAVFLLAAGLLAAIFLLANRKMIHANQAEISSRSSLNGMQMEFLTTMESVKIAAAEKKLFERWENMFSKTVDKTRKSEFARMTTSTILSLMSIALPILVLLFSLHVVDSGRITTGDAIALYSMASIASGNIITVLTSFCYIELTQNYLDRLQDILSQGEEKSGDIIAKDISSIELQNISFRYNKNSPDVLKNVNMRLDRGKKIAIVGESGSGKSSIAKLLVKLYVPSSGQLLYNGIPQDKLDNESLRRTIGLIPQAGCIFNCSVWDNIVMLSDNYNEDDVINVCKDLHLHNDIMQMPMKYETILSERGSNISGGQKQKILIARALLSNADFLILDEATCSLDSISENAVYDALNRRKCTQIIITHRLSTIVDADYIYVIKDNTVYEEGTHAELVQSKGVYYSLLNKAVELDQ